MGYWLLAPPPIGVGEVVRSEARGRGRLTGWGCCGKLGGGDRDSEATVDFIVTSPSCCSGRLPFRLLGNVYNCRYIYNY